MCLLKPFVLIVIAIGCVSQLHARQWTDATGRLKIDADFFAASDDTVVVKRRNGSLVALKIDQLSSEDQVFVQEKKTLLDSTVGDDSTKPGDLHTWTSAGGFEFRGRVIAFGRRDVSIQRTAGVVTVNGTALSRLNTFYQHIAPQIVAHYADPSVSTMQDLDRWLRNFRGNPPTFTVEGVLMKLEDGSELAVPFFLLSEKDLAILSPGWEQWKQEHASEMDRKREDFLMTAQAESYQQQREADAASHQIQMMQLELLAVNAGLVAIWEVMLRPRPGVYARPTSVIVPAQNSLDAEQQALQNYPGFTVIGVRRASN
jgi:hypothetical protein